MKSIKKTFQFGRHQVTLEIRRYLDQHFPGPQTPTDQPVA